MKIKIGREKAVAKVYLAWLIYIRERIVAGIPTTETERYRIGGDISIENVNREIVKLKKEIAS